MIKILFICHGNICRSPMAEFIMKSKTNNYYIESAATSTEEIGNPIYKDAKEELIKHKIFGFEEKRARQVIKDDYNIFDYLIIMDEENKYSLAKIIGEDKDKKVHKLLEFVGNSKDICDPWYTRNFDLCFEEIDKGCDALIQYLDKQ